MLLLRITVNPESIFKLTINNELENVEQLKNIIKEKYDIKYEFVVLYMDKDFGEYVTLTSVRELYNLCSLKVEKTDVDQGEVNIPTVMASTSDVHKTWPSVFPLPEFDEESNVFVLNAHNKLTQIPLRIRKRIVSQVANSLLKWTSYPTSKDITSVCSRMVDKYPVLRDDGPGGFESWSISIKFKMGNLRRSLKEQLPELQANVGKRSKDNPDGPTSHTSIKKVRRGVVERFPEKPQGETEESLHDIQESLKLEMSKTVPSMQNVS